MRASSLFGAVLTTLALCAAAADKPRDRDWPMYGGDAGKTRHSTLDQLHRGNVSSLQEAWRYDTGEKGDTQTQPIVVGRVLYGYTPTHKAFALDAATGKLLWTFDSLIQGVGANRGLSHWSDGKHPRVFAAVDNFVYALDAATGKPIETFGTSGRIDLRENLGRDPATPSGSRAPALFTKTC
jgi:quinoprotein glucose dehydrogenase